MDIRRLIAIPRTQRYSAHIIPALIVGIPLIPALLIGSWFAHRWAESERGQMEKVLAQQASEIASEVDREINAATSLLTAMASSNWLRTGDFERFHRQASEVAHRLDTQIVLVDGRLNKQVVNTAAPWGAPLPQVLQPEVMNTVQEALRTDKLVVSNVFVGPLIRQPALSVGLRATDDAGVPYYLAIGLPTDRFEPVLRRATIGSGRIAALLDRNNVFISRSLDHARFTGTRVAADAPPPTLQEGVLRTNNRDGTSFYWFLRRTPLTGWTVGIGVPAQALDAPANFATTYYAAASGILFIVAIGLSYSFGARLSRSFGSPGIDRQPTRAEFRILFELAPNGVLLVDQEGAILLVNARVIEDFGYPRAELTGWSIETLLPERFRDEIALLRQRCASERAAGSMIAEDKFYGRRKDGSEFPIEILLNPISTVAGNFIMVTVINLSERSRAERTIAQAAAALRASEEQRHLAVEAAEIGVWTWDFSTNTLAWSERMREIIGASPDTEPTHENYFDRIHPQDRRIVEENTDRARLSLQNFESEYRIIRADDRLLRWVSSTGRIRYDTSGNPIGMHGVIQDITRRKEAELERNDLLRRLMEAQEQERLRLAQDLHDQTGQSVTAVLLQIKHIEAQITGPAHCELEALRNQLERMGKSLHRIAWELRPASIDELGLVSSLTNYIDEWSALTKIDAVLYGSDASTQDLPKDVNAAIYRILQEALTNISKHAASATTVSVVVDRRGDTLRLTVSDNGPGFDSSAHFSGLGLAGMRERLAVIGGELEIESVVGIGTTIIARIPLAGPV